MGVWTKFDRAPNMHKALVFIGTAIASKQQPTNPNVIKKFFTEYDALINRNGSSFRSEVITPSNMADKLPTYGCWCTKIYNGNGYGGRPADDLDELCKKWSKC